jgi:hypothetical protein
VVAGPYALHNLNPLQLCCVSDGTTKPYMQTEVPKQGRMQHNCYTRSRHPPAASTPLLHFLVSQPALSYPCQGSNLRQLTVLKSAVVLMQT